MIGKVTCIALLGAAATNAASAQTFSPSDRTLLMQSTTTAGSSASAARTKDKSAKSTQARGSNPPVSISSELNGGPAGVATPEIRRKTGTEQQKNPFDERVPFGPLSLGLQAEAAPRSDSLTTPVPSGMEQFKKDRINPYFGLSIIDIKR